MSLSQKLSCLIQGVQSKTVTVISAHAHLLFGNRINEIYQTTPFDIAEIGRR